MVSKTDLAGLPPARRHAVVEAARQGRRLALADAIKADRADRTAAAEAAIEAQRAQIEQAGGIRALDRGAYRQAKRDFLRQLTRCR